MKRSALLVAVIVLAAGACTPVGSRPRVLAIAYSDLDGTDGYDVSSADVFISRLDDTNGDGVPSAGDTITLGQNPLNFDETAFGARSATRCIRSHTWT